MFSIGKGVALPKFQKDERFQQGILFFFKKDSKAEIKEARERLLVSLYGGKANNSLDQICLCKFHQKIALNNKVIQPKYKMLQVSILSGCIIKYKVGKKDNLNPKDWGWNTKKWKTFYSTQVKMQHQQVCSSYLDVAAK